MPASPLRSSSGAGHTQTPLSELAYRKVRDDIISGRLEPGSKLKLEALQDAYGYSNTPLREALNRLAAEKVVIADERRGFRVSPVSAEDFMDITRLRLTVECGALAESLRHGDDVWEANIVGALHRLDVVQSRSARAMPMTIDTWTPRHKDFHMSLLASCPSKRLVGVASEAFDQAGRYRVISSRYRYRPRDAHAEHHELSRLALTRKSDGAVQLLKQHILKTADSVLKALKHLPGYAC